jgi:hypothetical protein
MYRSLFPQFVEDVIKSIHKVFFSEKNILLHEHRLEFIELFYLFLQMKLLDICKPDYFSLTCKDGADTGACANAQLFIFLKLLQKDDLSNHDRKQINKLLYAPALFLRERLVQPERFQRFLSAIKCLELAKERMGAQEFAKSINDNFGKLFEIPLADLVIDYEF